MSISYRQVAAQLSPLDLILFKGADFVSKTIRFLEQEELKDGDFSHSGVLVNSEILPGIKQLIPGRWYVWESTMSATSGFFKQFADGVPNSLTGKGKLGVQIRDFEEVVDAYLKSPDTAVAWCKLKSNPWLPRPNETVTVYASRKQELIDDIQDIYQEYGNRTYDLNCLDLLGSLFPCCRKPRDALRTILVEERTIFSSLDLNVDPTGWLFCSQLVAIIYQDLGLIDSSKNPLNVVPVDFLGVDSNGIPKIVENPVYITP